MGGRQEGRKSSHAVRQMTKRQIQQCGQSPTADCGVEYPNDLKRSERDTEEVKRKAQDLEGQSSNRLRIGQTFFSPRLEMLCPSKHRPLKKPLKTPDVG